MWPGSAWCTDQLIGAGKPVGIGRAPVSTLGCWPAYEAGLRQRGSLTVWFSEEAVAAWAAAPRTTRGGQASYSPLAILTALTLRAVFRLAYRQAEGLIGSIISLLGLTLRSPDHTTFSRRSATLAVPRPQPNNIGAGDVVQPLHLLVDSTGLKLCGAGECWSRSMAPGRAGRCGSCTSGWMPTWARSWLRRWPAKRSTMRLRLARCSIRPPAPLASLTADGAYDQDGVYADVAERHPDAAVMAPSTCGRVG
jgi:hypothetical protein